MPCLAVFGLMCILGAVASNDSGECSGDIVTGFSSGQSAAEGIHTELQTVKAECPITCGSSCCNTEGCNIAVYDNATTEGTPNCRLLTCNPLEACIGYIEETDATFVVRVTRNLVRKKREAPDAGNPQGFPQLSGNDPSGIISNTTVPGAGTSPAGSNTTTVSSQANNSSGVPVSSNNTATTTSGATSSKADNNAPNGNVSQGEGQGVLIGGDGTINQSIPVPQANITQNVNSDATNSMQDKSTGVEIGGAGVIGTSVPSPIPESNATDLNSTLSPSLSGKQDMATPPPPGGLAGGVPGDNVTSNATLSPPLSEIQDKDQGMPIADDSKLSGASYPTPPPLGNSTVRTPPPPSPATPPFPTSPETPAASSPTSSTTPNGGTTSYPTPPPLGNINQTTFPTPPPPSTAATSFTSSGPTTSSQTQSPTTTQGPTTSVTTTSQYTIIPPKRLTTVSTTKNPSSETTTTTIDLSTTTSSTTTSTTQSTSPAATTLSLATEQTTLQSTTPSETPAQTTSSTTQTTPNDVGSTTFSPTTSATTNPQGNASDAAIVEAEEMLAGAILEQETNILSKETPVSSGGNGTLNQSASTSQADSGHLMVVVLASALSIGLFIFLVVIIIVGKRVFESWQRRHYSRVDYLVNGMYN